MVETPHYKRLTKKMKGWLEAYARNACNVTETCRATSISVMTISRWTRGSEEFKTLREEVEESLIDLAESKLMQMIKKGENLGAICFFLKCKAKHRGYVERSEQSHDVSGSLSLKIERVPMDAGDKDADEASND